MLLRLSLIVFATLTVTSSAQSPRTHRLEATPDTISYGYEGMTLTWPRAETATDYISMGTDEDLKVATTVAVQEMVDFLAGAKGLSKHEAYQLVSIAGHVAITQLVDRPVYGVHVRMPKSTFK
jgi:acetamidase/formamidase